MKRLLCMLACSLMWIAPAYGQVCGGGVSFAKQPYQLNASLLTNDGGKLYTMGGGVGSGVWWGQGGLNFTTFDGVNGTAKGLFITGGGDFAVDSDKKIYACPILSIAHSGALGNLEGSSNLVTFGGSVGFIATKADSVTIIPTGALFLHHESFSFPISTFNSSENSGSLQLGVGFIVNERMALVPGFVVPFGQNGGKNSFSVKFAYYFGK